MPATRRTLIPFLEALWRRRSSPVAITVLGGWLSQFLTLLSGAVLARALGVEGRGLYAAVTLVPLLTISLGSLGLPVAYLYQSAQRKIDAGKLASNAGFLIIIQSLILIGLAAVIIPSVIDDPITVRLSILFAAVAIPTQLMGKYLNSILQGKGAVYRFNLYRNVTALINTLGVLGMLLLNESELTAALAIWLFGSVIAALISLISVVRMLRPSWMFDGPLMMGSLRYGLRAHLGNITPIESVRLDMIFVVGFLSAYDTGLYTVAFAVANAMRAQAQNMGYITIPTISGQPDRLGKMLVSRRYSNATIILVLGFAIVLAVFAGPLISLVYGYEFSEAVTTTRLLILAMVFASFKQLIGDLMRAFGAPGVGSLAEIVSWVAVIVLFPLLVPSYGLLGVGVGVIGAYFASLVAVVFLTARRGFSVLELLGLRRTV